MQKAVQPSSSRPRLLAASAGPTRRLHHQTILSPRNRPGSQRTAPPLRPPGKGGPVKKVGFHPIASAPGPNGKVSVDQVLKQLSCANEKVLTDVVESISRSSGSTVRGAPVLRTRSGPPAARDRKTQGDMLLESFNSVAFRQQIQRTKPRAATMPEKSGRSGQLTPIRTKVDKPRSPRYVHHTRVSAPGPCKCKACKTKRNESDTPPGKASRVPSAKSASSASPLYKNKTVTQRPIGSQVHAKPNALVKKPMEKSSSSPALGSIANGTKSSESQKKHQNAQQSISSESSTKKPFAFLQTLFKSGGTADEDSKKAEPPTGNSSGKPAIGANNSRPDVTSGDKKPGSIEKPSPKSSGGTNASTQGQKTTSPQATKILATVQGDAKPASATYDRLRLSTISEEKRGSHSASSTLRRHSEDLTGSVTLGKNADDLESVVSYPFPRPRTGSTCCQSFQFMEVVTGCAPNGEGAGGNRMLDLEPFGMFEAIDGVVGGGNFINLKEDLEKNRKVIKSRLGVRRDDKPETVIQWKRGPILGRGAFGTVWCGLTMAGEMVAVKQAEISSIDLQKAQKEYEKIQQEVDLLKSLSHKNIVGYLGTSLEDRIVSIFMQFIPGGSLTSILKKFGALAEPVVACYTKQILEGVEYLHSKNVVHRDIKGSNVMLMPNAVIKLIDFGCAKRAINLTKSSEEILKSMKGTPYWMAPEVMNETGHGKKSDIWSVGCTVFEMATSRPPWSHLNRYAALFTISNGTAPTPQLPDKFSDEAKRFVAECMTRESDKRPDASTLLNSSFVVQHCQQSGRRILDSRGIPLNSTKRQ